MTLVHALRSLETIPAFKGLQPWASWIVWGTKREDIRSRQNHYRGVIGILASGWDTRFDRETVVAQYPYAYEHYCLIGLCRLTGVTRYRSRDQFVRSYSKHLNPPELYRKGLFGWVLEDVTPIVPLYYEHQKNKNREYLLPLRGNYAQVRISVRELLYPQRLQVINVDKVDIL